MLNEDAIRALAEIKEAGQDEDRTDEEKAAARVRAAEAIRTGLRRDAILGRNVPGRGNPRGVANRIVEPE